MPRTKLKQPIKIPFDSNDNLSYYLCPYTSLNAVWKDNYIFTDTMKINELYKNSSAVNVKVISMESGKEYRMFLFDLVELIKNNTIKNGIIKGNWTFVKRGIKFGIKLV